MMHDSEPSGRGDGARILAVDDSPTQLLQLEHALQQANFSVFTARDGRAAFELATEIRPDLVISDIVMPEMDGFALCKALRAHEELRPVPVILLTTLAAIEDVLGGIECGASGFITKPYDGGFLLEQVSRALERHRPRVEGERGPAVFYGGRWHPVGADPQQMLELLLSTYANAVQQNLELLRTREHLRQANEDLEEKVRLRTAELSAEVVERKRAEAKLLQLATEDPLTGLANRKKFIDHLALALAQAKRYGNGGAVLFLDLDGFKRINDDYGHHVGDQALCEVAERLLATTRESDTVARLGGDEFAVVLTRAERLEAANAVARRILDALVRPLATAEGHRCELGVSIGISLFPSDGLTVERLLERADAAMYMAKRAGGRRFSAFAFPLLD